MLRFKGSMKALSRCEPAVKQQNKERQEACDVNMNQYLVLETQLDNSSMDSVFIHTWIEEPLEETSQYLF